MIRVRSSYQALIARYLNYFLLVCIAVVTIYPMINLFAKSISSESYVLKGEVFLWPKGLQFETLGFMVRQRSFTQSMFNSLLVTVGGTVVSLLLTITGAYPVSRRRLVGRRIFMLYIVFTMLFSGGMIPTFILVRRLGMVNTLWALIIPPALSPFWLIILKNYFEGVPDSLEESAKMDGASNIQVLLMIMLPMAIPAIATLIVFYAIGRWNVYFEALLYITDRKKYTLQQYLYELLQGVSGSSMINVSLLRSMRHRTPQIVQGAAILLSIIPILVVYPLLQRYFVKGMTLGAVKG